MRLNYKSYIDNIPNHPIDGIMYRDIQPLLSNDTVFQQAIIDLGTLTHEVPDYWVGIESRGFIFASALAIHFGGGVKLIRKWDKLPPIDLVTVEYEKEYGVDMIQMKKGNGTVVIVDDVYATGGTIEASSKLVSEAGYKLIDSICLIDIKLKESSIKSVIQYES